MQLSEKEIEQFIFDDLRDENGYGMFQRGLNTEINRRNLENDQVPQSTWFRQFNLGEYGIVDIVGFHRYCGSICIELFELKAVPLECSHIDQIMRYKTGITNYLLRERPNLDFYIKSYLIGLGLESGHYIQNHIPNLVLAEVSYDLSGIGFKSHKGNWCRTNDKDFSLTSNLRKRHAKEIY